MQEFAVILMLKHNGKLEKELASVRITRHGELISSMFVEEQDGLTVKMIVQAPGELQDWEFQAIYDYYDMGVFDGLGLAVSEAQGEDNPCWEIAFPYTEDAEKLADKAAGILNIHRRELDGVLSAIKEAEGEYNDVR